jgi:hypothetical protein
MRHHFVNAFGIEGHFADSQRSAHFDQFADRNDILRLRGFAEEVDVKTSRDRQRHDPNLSQDRHVKAAKAITRLYGASRLFVNFFQPSFKLASKHREGARVSKRYPPQTPCERLLQAELPENAKIQLRTVASSFDPLKLLEEIRAMQAHMQFISRTLTFKETCYRQYNSVWRAHQSNEKCRALHEPSRYRTIRRPMPIS